MSTEDSAANESGNDSGTDSENDDAQAEMTTTPLYSTVQHDDGKAHFVDPTEERNEFDGEASEVDEPVFSLCSFEKPGAVHINSEEVAVATIADLCGHCRRAIADEAATALTELAGQPLTADDDEED